MSWSSVFWNVGLLFLDVGSPGFHCSDCRYWAKLWTWGGEVVLVHDLCRCAHGPVCHVFRLAVRVSYTYTSWFLPSGFGAVWMLSAERVLLGLC